MEHVNLFLPEIFLAVSILATLMAGVFLKNSYLYLIL